MTMNDDLAFSLSKIKEPNLTYTYTIRPKLGKYFRAKKKTDDRNDKRTLDKIKS